MSINIFHDLIKKWAESAKRRQIGDTPTLNSLAYTECAEDLERLLMGMDSNNNRPIANKTTKANSSQAETEFTDNPICPYCENEMQRGLEEIRPGLFGVDICPICRHKFRYRTHDVIQYTTVKFEGDDSYDFSDMSKNDEELERLTGKRCLLKDIPQPDEESDHLKDDGYGPHQYVEETIESRINKFLGLEQWEEDQSVKCLGECAIIVKDCSLIDQYEAVLFIWDDEFADMEKLADWFMICGVEKVITISWVLLDNNNGDKEGKTREGSRQILIHFKTNEEYVRRKKISFEEKIKNYEVEEFCSAVFPNLEDVPF